MTKLITTEERRLLHALAWMSQQYLARDGFLEHMFMSAGEGAIELLAEYGMVDAKPGGGTWTKAGEQLLDA